MYSNFNSAENVLNIDTIFMTVEEPIEEIPLPAGS